VRIVSIPVMVPRICLLALCLPFSTMAGLVRFEVTERSPVLQGKSFGTAGAYERLVGRVYFAVDPNAQANQLITNLKRAPRNDRGEVTFFADFYVISPVDPRKGNGTLLFEVGNRGRKGLLTAFSRAKSSFDPRTEAEFGDGLLLKEGFTQAWVGWQFDVPREPPLMSVTVPVARDPAGPIIGLVRSDFVPDEKIHSFSLGDRAFLQYPVIDRSDPSATLTERDGSEGTPRLIPRSQWQFAREKDGRPVPDAKHVYLSSGFEPGKIYEVVYRSQDPPVVGLGMAAVRDFVSYFRNGAKGAEAGPLDSIRSSLKRTLGFGSSQSGRFLRTFLYFGLNQDERGQRVFDGVWAHVAGGGRGSFNFQFAQPSRDARPFFNFHYPTDIFPFTEVSQTTVAPHRSPIPASTAARTCRLPRTHACMYTPAAIMGPEPSHRRTAEPSIWKMPMTTSGSCARCWWPCSGGSPKTTLLHQSFQRSPRGSWFYRIRSRSPRFVE
jgi:hypothetical protein